MHEYIELRKETEAKGRARKIAFARLPTSQKAIINREGERIRAKLHSIRVAQGKEPKINFGPVAYLELLEKLGQFLSEVE